jgi:hypothetical protein
MADDATMTRLADIRTFYKLLDQLAAKQSGPVTLGALMQRQIAPRGVYFFFEAGEHRSDSGHGPRVTRIGTHGLTPGAKSTLRSRLRHHRGTRSGAGNHRSSIFRLLTGDALMRAGAAPACASWGNKDFARIGLDRATVQRLELSLEHAVSVRLAAMQVLWLDIGDAPGPKSLRGLIERNAIALLSNEARPPIDAPSQDWLGHYSSRPHVRASGLWNQDHVDKTYDPSFLATLDRLIQQLGR